MPLTVLIVDDDRSFRGHARALLERDGCVVAGEAEDGASALSTARNCAADVMLLDIQLPDTDGFEVARRLRAEHSDLPVVLTSSRDAEDYGTLIERSSAIGFLPKQELSRRALAALLLGPRSRAPA